MKEEGEREDDEEVYGVDWVDAWRWEMRRVGRDEREEEALQMARRRAGRLESIVDRNGKR